MTHWLWTFPFQVFILVLANWDLVYVTLWKRCSPARFQDWLLVHEFQIHLPQDERVLAVSENESVLYVKQVCLAILIAFLWAIGQRILPFFYLFLPGAVALQALTGAYFYSRVILTNKALYACDFRKGKWFIIPVDQIASLKMGSDLHAYPFKVNGKLVMQGCGFMNIGAMRRVLDQLRQEAAGPGGGA